MNQIYQKQAAFVIPNSKPLPKDDVSEQSSFRVQYQQAEPILPNNQIWKKDGLSIIYQITKFIKQLKAYSQNLKMLTPQIFQIISDQAADENEAFIKQKSILTQISIPFFMPESMSSLILDLFVLAQLAYNIGYSPLQLAFNLNQFQTFWGSILLILLYMLKNCVTGYYERGIITQNRKLILLNYLKQNFWIDTIILIGTSLQDQQYSSIDYVIMDILLIIASLIRLKGIISNIEEMFLFIGKAQAILKIFNQILFILYVTHVCACIWSYAGEYELKLERFSWLEDYGIQNESWETKYLNALYFSAVTTITVGYGDITPRTNLEKVIVIMMTMTICGVLGYTISSIGDILKELNVGQDKYRKQMNFMINYFKQKKIGQQLFQEVKKYFECYYQMEQESDQLGFQLLQSLSKGLREKVTIDMYYTMLLNSRLIRKTLTKKATEHLCQFVHEQNFIPDEVIIQQNSIPDRLYFPLSGNLTIVCNLENKMVKLKDIKENKSLGEVQFIIQQPYHYSIMATNFCKLAYINLTDFQTVLQQEKSSHQKFFKLSDDLKFNHKIQKNYNGVCLICGWTHYFMHCPTSFYIPNKDKFITNKNVMQSRRQYNRVQPKQMRSRIKNVERGLKFQIENKVISISELNDEYLDLIGFQCHIKYNSQLFKKSIGSLLVTDPNIRQFSSENLTPQHQESPKEFQSLQHQIFTQQNPQELNQTMKTTTLRINRTNQEFEIDSYYNYDDYNPENNLVEVLKKLKQERSSHFIHPLIQGWLYKK